MVEKIDDLIQRSQKYARSAGRTGLGHYKAATVKEHLHIGLTAICVTLSAVVGTSIFAQLSQKYPIEFGLAAVSAAALSAVQGSLKLAEQAKNHRDAGADYGRLRRKVDLLRLRLEAGDITREKGLAELEEIGNALSDCARQSPVLSDRQYYTAVKNFDRDHPGYCESHPSHAGGVVIRQENGNIQYLIVNAKNQPDIWVLPKGHIKTGESAEQAAKREVQEETGINTYVRETLDCVEFSSPEEQVKVQFFLMKVVSEEQSHENRNLKWCSHNEAVRLLNFKESKRLIFQAQALLQESLLPQPQQC